MIKKDIFYLKKLGGERDKKVGVLGGGGVGVGVCVCVWGGGGGISLVHWNIITHF